MTTQSILSKPHLRATAMPKFLAAAAMLSFSLSAHAGNIVADGGFESADCGINGCFAGSSIDGGSWTVVKGVVYIDSDDPYVYAGSNSLNLTAFNPDTANSVSQTLATIAGDSYLLNFWANSDSSNIFSLLANGSALSGAPADIVDNGFPNQTTNNSSLFQDYSEVFQANSSSTTLTFSDTASPSIQLGSNESGSVMIDNVSVVQVTPEPGSLVLLATGMLALGLLSMRKHLSHSGAC